MRSEATMREWGKRWLISDDSRCGRRLWSIWRQVARLTSLVCLLSKKVVDGTGKPSQSLVEGGRNSGSSRSCCKSKSVSSQLFGGKVDPIIPSPHRASVFFFVKKAPQELGIQTEPFLHTQDTHYTLEPHQGFSAALQNSRNAAEETQQRDLWGRGLERPSRSLQ